MAQRHTQKETLQQRSDPASNILERDSTLSWSSNDEFITCCRIRLGYRDIVLALHIKA